MPHRFTLAGSLALALGLAACAGGPATNEISPVANVGSAVGSNPGQPVSPSEPAAISQSLTNTDALARQQQPTARQRRMAQPSRRPAATNSEFSGARGRAPAPAQPQGNGGS